MTDCPNVEIRELLPELLHDALPVADRARVQAHLAQCAACAAELSLLREARRALAGVRMPAINTASIVAALPRPQASSPLTLVGGDTRHAAVSSGTSANVPVRRRSPMLYRIAAAVTFISLGGMSLTIARSYFGAGGGAVVADSARRGDTALPSAAPVAAVDTSATSATPTASRGLAVHGVVSELDDASLESLISELDKLDAAPLAEPEGTPGSRLVASTSSGS